MNKRRQSPPSRRRGSKTQFLLLPQEHVLSRLTGEHEQILDLLEHLDGLRRDVVSLDSPADGPHLLKDLHLAVQELMKTEPHHEREEKVLFPSMESRGVTDYPYTLRLQHELLRDLIQKLVEVVRKTKPEDFPEYQAKVDYFGRSISRLLRKHIETEDAVLFPIALKKIRDESDWARLEKACDKIGYCTFGALGSIKE